MMGSRREAQTALFYEFNLEDHVPADHLLRSIDRFIDLSDIRTHLRPFYSNIGRPSVEPELMIRRDRHDRCLCRCAATTKESRDAVCTSQTHHEA